MPTESQEVIRIFTKRLNVAIDYHRELLLAVHLKKHQASLETMLAEQFVFNIAVLWEVFLNDLLLAYVVIDPSVYLRGLKDRVTLSLKDRYGAEVAKCAKLEFPSKVNRLKAEAFIDPKNFNISVNSASSLAKKANELLAAPYARKFTLNGDDAHFADFVISMRNYLGHRSTAARNSLKSSLHPLGAINADLAGTFKDAGTYLKQRNAAGDTRAIFIAQRLIQVANVL